MRRNGRHAVVNVSDVPKPMPAGRVVPAGRRPDGDRLPGETTVWTVRP